VGTAILVTNPPDQLPPAFYAAPSAVTRRSMRDWWIVLHPPYTLWHLSYVVIGACLAPHVDGERMAATLVAFFLAVGVGAHALDELHGRPLRTSIPGWALTVAAVASLASAVGLGLVGVARVGPGLAVFIVVGVVLALGYNLELLGGRLHNDATFALAWGAFPVLTAYYAQTRALRVPAVIAAAAAFGLSCAQRHLSTPARNLRRRATAVDGTITMRDGRSLHLDSRVLLAPLEAALRTMAWSLVALAAAMAAARLTTW
jgi:hypothetical protein